MAAERRKNLSFSGPQILGWESEGFFLRGDPLIERLVHHGRFIRFMPNHALLCLESNKLPCDMRRKLDGQTVLMRSYKASGGTGKVRSCHDYIELFSVPLAL